jgi:hypothetical protein
MSQVTNELNVLRRIDDYEISNYVPKKYSFMIDDNERVLVIERFGPSLEEISKVYGRNESYKFSKPTNVQPQLIKY